MLSLDQFKDMFPYISKGKIGEILKKHQGKNEGEILDILLKINEEEEIKAANKEIKEEEKKEIKKNPEIDREKVDLQLYKTLQCININCDDPQCFYFHDEFDRRRDLSQFHYIPVPCIFVYGNGEWFEPNQCPDEDNCKYSHTQNELYFHPKYKKKQNKRRQPESNKISNKNTEELKKNLEDLKISIENKNQEIDKTVNEINEIDQEIKENARFLNCCKCKKEEMDWLVIPCCHGICTSCKLTAYEACPLCGIIIQSSHPINNDF